MNTRRERDSLGELDVPEDVLYGIHTVRSIRNFDAGGEPVPTAIIHAMTRLKLACARANHALGLLDGRKTAAITKACETILSGQVDGQFPIDILQAGSGTSSNMNINEVVANLANETLGGRRGSRHPVHPNDDVNMGQSSNSIFPSAIRLVAVSLSVGTLESVRLLVRTLEGRAAEFRDVIKSGRTHLQDAVPMTLGQEFAAWARALTKDIERMRRAVDANLELVEGGNALGTGINTRSEYRTLVANELSAISGFPFRVALNGVEVTQFLTDPAELSGALRLTAQDIGKICNDLRLLCSGPNTGLAEITLPAVEPGSSIMPGKINPSIVESTNMAMLQILGHDHVVQLASAAGQLELNTHMPVLALNLVKALRLMDRACVQLANKCVAGITANVENCYRHFETSGGLATILNPLLGYERVAALVKESLAFNKTAKQIVIEQGILTAEEFEVLVRRSVGMIH
jgi:aspartate ammonia-lyase